VMEELNEKISQILSDNDSMEKLRKMAESLLGDSAPVPTPKTGGDEIDISKILPIINRLKTPQNNSRTALLLALRPHLSRERQARLDKAVKLLKVAELLPFIQESGLFDL